jgi:hypothetical protein
MILSTLRQIRESRTNSEVVQIEMSTGVGEQKLGKAARSNPNPAKHPCERVIEENVKPAVRKISCLPRFGFGQGRLRLVGRSPLRYKYFALMEIYKDGAEASLN